MEICRASKNSASIGRYRGGRQIGPTRQDRRQELGGRDHGNGRLALRAFDDPGQLEIEAEEDGPVVFRAPEMERVEQLVSVHRVVPVVGSSFAFDGSMLNRSETSWDMGRRVTSSCSIPARMQVRDSTGVFRDLQSAKPVDPTSPG